MNDEFYVGWEDKAPSGIARRVRLAAFSLLASAVALGAVLAAAQRTIGTSVFEWGKLKEFSGIFESRPYPHLLVPRPGTNAVQSGFSSYYLVKPFKFGIEPETARRFDGKPVHLKGTLIYRGNQTMIEVANDSIQSRDPSTLQPFNPSTMPINLGEQTLVGEIVDSKCYLGVMNPGALTPHRACAIRCISGGIPPVLLVRRTNASALHFLLVDRNGEPVNKRVLGIVAEPVRITGDVERQGDLLILRADPATYRRLAD